MRVECKESPRPPQHPEFDPPTFEQITFSVSARDFRDLSNFIPNGEDGAGDLGDTIHSENSDDPVASKSTFFKKVINNNSTSIILSFSD